MPIGASRYTKHDLTPVQREALYRSARQLADLFLDDLCKLARRECLSRAPTWPGSCRGSISTGTTCHSPSTSLVCVLTVAWKLREPRHTGAGVHGRGAALRAIVEEARAVLLA